MKQFAAGQNQNLHSEITGSDPSLFTQSPAISCWLLIRAEPQSESCDLDKVLSSAAHSSETLPPSFQLWPRIRLKSVHQYSLIIHSCSDLGLTQYQQNRRGRTCRTGSELWMFSGPKGSNWFPEHVSVSWDYWFSLSYWINRILSVWFWWQDLEADHQEQNQLFTEHLTWISGVVLDSGFFFNSVRLQ